jgi:hypothetical protein
MKYIRRPLESTLRVSKGKRAKHLLAALFVSDTLAAKCSMSGRAANTTVNRSSIACRPGL